MRRFQIKLRDLTGIDIGIDVAEFIVNAESPAEAEMYVRQVMEPHFSGADNHCPCPDCRPSPWEMVTREVPTAD